jgi:hypothetical protein
VLPLETVDKAFSDSVYRRQCRSSRPERAVASDGTLERRSWNINIKRIIKIMGEEDKKRYI